MRWVLKVFPLLSPALAQQASNGPSQGPSLGPSGGPSNGPGVEIDVLGQSGKVKLFSSALGANDPNKVTIEMDALRELDEAGNMVGNTGAVKHSVNTFASQDFSFSDLETVTMGVGNSVTAEKLSFESTISDGVGEIKVDTFIMMSEGMVGPDGEEWSVGIGDMKFNIGFPSWNWCGDAGYTCGGGGQRLLQGGGNGGGNSNGNGGGGLSPSPPTPTTPSPSPSPPGGGNGGGGNGGGGNGGGGNGGTSAVGQFLELDIKIKGSADSVTLIPGSVNTYSLGGGANLTLTRKVMIDGSQSELPEGYPQITQQGGSQIFTFRFPRFNSSALYDPLIATDWSPTPSPSPSPSPSPTPPSPTPSPTPPSPTPPSPTPPSPTPPSTTPPSPTPPSPTPPSPTSPTPTPAPSPTPSSDSDSGTTVTSRTITGSFNMVVEDPVQFAQDDTVKSAIAEAIANSAGPAVNSADVTVSITVARRLAHGLGGVKRRLEGSVRIEYSIEVPVDSDASAMSDSLAAMDPLDLVQQVNAILVGQGVDNAVIGVSDVSAPAVTENRSPPDSNANDIFNNAQTDDGSSSQSSLSILTCTVLAALGAV